MPINTALIAAIAMIANWPSINARKKLITLTNVRKTKNLGKIVRKKHWHHVRPASERQWAPLLPNGKNNGSRHQSTQQSY